MQGIVRCIIFLAVGVILFQMMSGVFLEKNSYAKYRNFHKQDQIDVLVLGSSHSDNGIGPELIEKKYLEKTGQELSVFNYSIYGMRVEQMYYFMKEALKKHIPKMIIIETFAFVPIADEHREILARRAFDMMPLSRNKIEAIQYCVNSDYWSYYIPFMKYHTRWKELKGKDIEMLYKKSSWGKAGLKGNYEDGSMEEIDDYFMQDAADLEEMVEITETEKESLERILKLAEEYDINVLFVSVPFKQQLGMDSLHMIKVNNYVKEHYTNGTSVQMLDMNRMWKTLDFGYSDLYNEGHCNKSGAKKVTYCLADYMLENYEINELLEYEG